MQLILLPIRNKQSVNKKTRMDSIVIEKTVTDLVMKEYSELTYFN